jgi:hypothetical protein
MSATLPNVMSVLDRTSRYAIATQETVATSHLKYWDMVGSEILTMVASSAHINDASDINSRISHWRGLTFESSCFSELMEDEPECRNKLIAVPVLAQ